MHKSNLKRLNIRLDKNLAEIFDKYSEKVGKSKSSLLRELVAKFDPSYKVTTFHEGGGQATFNFKIDSESYESLKKLSKERAISMSALIRIIIINLNSRLQPDKSNTQSSFHKNELIKTGNFYELKQLLESDEDNLTDSEVISLAETNIKLGDLNKTRSLLTRYYLNKKDTTFDKVFVRANLIKAELLIFDGKIKEAEFEIKNSFTIANLIKDRYLLGKVFCLHAEIYRLLERYDEALDCFERSLEYFDVFHHYNLIADVYIRIARCLLYKLDIENSNKYLSRAKRILTENHNSFYLAQYFNTLGLVESLTGNFQLSKKHFQQSFEYNLANKCYKEVYFNCENLMRISLANSDYDEVLRLARSSSSKMFQAKKLMGRFEVYKVIAQSKYLYKDSVKELNYMLAISGKQFKPELYKYTLNSIKYINGPNKVIIKQGENGLKELEQGGSFKLIKKVANYTLDKKAIHPNI